MNDLRGIYITRRQCIKDSEGLPKRVVTGHYISLKSVGATSVRQVVHSFSQCTLSCVIAAAERVIDNPRVFLCEEQENLWTLGYNTAKEGKEESTIVYNGRRIV